MALMFLYPSTFALGGQFISKKLSDYFTDPHCPKGYVCSPEASPSPTPTPNNTPQ